MLDAESTSVAPSAAPRAPRAARKVLFLLSAMTEGGAERVAAQLCNHWVNEGHAVTLMPTFSGRGACVYPLDERVELDYLADRVGSTKKSGWNYVRRFLALRRAVREIAPDVIVSFLTHVNVATLIATAGLSVPVFVSERIYPPSQPIGAVWLWLAKCLYRRAARVVAQTHGVARWIAANCAGARVTVIPNPVGVPVPVAEPRLCPDRWVGDCPMVLAAGRLVEQKGFKRLLTAFAALADVRRDWHLVILGDGPDREALEAYRDELGLAGCAHFPGRAGNIGDWYERADLFVMSSYFEGFPNALLEAMTYGVPVVSVDCPTGPADIIRHDIDGLLVAESDGVEGIIAAMRRLMTDDALRLRMGHRAREARLRFAIEDVSKSWFQLFEAERQN